MSLMLNDRFASMPWDSIDSVVFDIGNVLMVFDPDAMLQILFPDEEELKARLMERVFHSPYWVMLDHGTLSPVEAARAMAGDDEAFREDVLHLLDHWTELTQPIDEGVKAMETARAHGKKIYLLSNYNDVFFSRTQKRHAYLRDESVDGMVISAHEKTMKPGAEIYHLLEKKYGLIPERTLFIDDAPANIEGALSVGWQGIWYIPGTLDHFFAC